MTRRILRFLFHPLPIQTHSIILRRVQAALHRIGYKVDIEYYGQD